MALTALVAVGAAAGGWWLNASKPAPAADGLASPVPIAGMPTMERASETQPSRVVQTPSPMPPIPGTTVDAVAAGWAKLLGTPPKPSARGYETTAPLPGAGYRSRFIVLKSPFGDGTEVAALFCTSGDEHIVRDRRLVRAVVDNCLGPALRGDEKPDLTAWLTEQDYSEDVHATREFPRFFANLVSAGTSYHVALYSKGQATPWAAPPTTAAAGG